MDIGVVWRSCEPVCVCRRCWRSSRRSPGQQGRLSPSHSTWDWWWWWSDTLSGWGDNINMTAYQSCLRSIIKHLYTIHSVLHRDESSEWGRSLYQKYFEATFLFLSIFINLEMSDFHLAEVPFHEVYLAYTPELLLKDVNLKQRKTSVRKFTQTNYTPTALQNQNTVIHIYYICI